MAAITWHPMLVPVVLAAGAVVPRQRQPQEEAVRRVRDLPVAPVRSFLIILQAVAAALVRSAKMAIHRATSMALGVMV